MDKIITIKNLLFANPIDNTENYFIVLKYSEIENILNTLDINEITKFCYFYRKCIHKILYEEEEMIIIDKSSGLSYFFYLSLLINDNTDIVNYSYQYNLINDLNDENKDNNVLKKIIISKFIIELIRNFRGLDNTENERYNENLEKMKTDNQEYINNNVYNFQEFDLNYNDDNIINNKTLLFY